MLISGSSEILSSPSIAIAGNAYLGSLLHSNTATRNYTFPDITGTVLLNTNVLGYALPTLSTGYLQWTGSAWAFGSGGGSVTLTDNNSTNATYYPVFATTAGGNTLETSSTKLSYNPSTGNLNAVAATFTGGISTNAGLNIIPVTTPASGSLALIMATGNLGIGLYYYGVVFQTAQGVTNYYQIGSITTTATQEQVTVTIPVSSDNRVTSRIIYRTKLGGSNTTIYVLTTIADNTTTTYTDNIADTSLTVLGNYYQVNTTTTYIQISGSSGIILDKYTTVLGVLAGPSSTGNSNTFIGYQAGYANTTGSGNCFLGSEAGVYNTTGSYNVAISVVAGGKITTGSNNSSFGYYALQSAGTSSSYNTVIGFYAMGNSSATAFSNSTAIGTYAGENSTASNAVFVGYSAGKYETVNNALVLDNIDRTTLALGRSNALLWGVTNATAASQILSLGGGGKVGIGTQTPGYALDIKGTTANSGINSDIGINFNPVPNPSTGFTAALQAVGGNLGIGAYIYLLAFGTAIGKTNLLEIGAVTTVSGSQQVLLTLPISPDYRVTQRLLYRTTVGGADYNCKLLVVINDNTTTTYTDNIADGSLGATNGSWSINNTCSQLTLGGTTASVVDQYATIYGLYAGTSLTTGGYNSFFGFDSGKNITTGNYNSCIGGQAGQSLTTGGNNTLVGSYAGNALVSGGYNVAVGMNCLLSAGAGSGSNTSIGSYALGSSGTFSNSTAMGYFAGYSATGSNNVFLGYTAGRYETTAGSTLLIDGLDRGNQATGRTNALIYGTMNATPASQTLSLGGGGTTSISGLLYANLPRNVVNSTNYTVTGTQAQIVVCTTITVASTITLPVASGQAGQIIWVIDESGLLTSTLSLTIVPNGSDTIEGNASFVLCGQYAAIALESNGSTKWTIFSYEELPIGVSDASYTIAMREDCIVQLNSITVSRIFTLPAATTTGQRITISDLSGSLTSSITLTITPNTTNTINGINASIVLTAPYSSLTFISNGNGKWSVSDRSPKTVSVASSIPAITLTRSDLSASVTITQSAAAVLTINAALAATQFNGSNAGLTTPVTLFIAAGTAVIGTDNHCTATGGNYALTLPAASACTGLLLLVSIDSTSTSIVTVTAAGSDVIDGLATRIMWAKEVAILKSNGTTWTKIGGKSIPMACGLGVNANQTFANLTNTLLTCFNANLFLNSPAAMQNTGSNELVCLRPGLYSIDMGGFVVGANNSTSCSVLLQVYKNGSAIFESINTFVTPNNTGIALSRQVVLAASDYVQPYGRYTAGSFTTNFLLNDAGAGLQNWFTLTEVPTW